MKWFFDGFGTQLFFFILGLIVCGGGIVLYKHRKKGRQFQKGGNNADQEQIAGCGDMSKSDQSSVKTDYRQTQKAADNAKQKQTIE